MNLKDAILLLIADGAVDGDSFHPCSASPLMNTNLDVGPTVGANCRGIVTADVSGWKLEMRGKATLVLRRLSSSAGKKMFFTQVRVPSVEDPYVLL